MAYGDGDSYGGYSTGSSENYGGTSGNVGGYSNSSGGGGSSPWGNYGLGVGTVEGFNPNTTLSQTDTNNIGFNPSTDYGFGGTLGQGAAGFSGATSNDIGNYSLSDMFGTGYTPGQYGLGMNTSSPSAQGLQVSQQSANNLGMLGMGTSGMGITGTDKESSVMDHPAVSFARTLLGYTPIGRIANLGIDAVRGKDIGASVIGAAVPGLAGSALGMGYNAARSNNPTASVGTQAAGMLGGMVGGSLAGAAGAQLGSQALGGLANAGFNQASRENASIGPYGQGSPMAAGIASAQNAGNTTGPSAAGGGGTNWGQLAGTLYGGYQANKQANQLAQNSQQTQQALQSQMSGLQNMYAPDSPYAKQLAQQLARQDAKAGRNSQYGTRAVELQARLAAMAPTVANSMSSLGQSSNLTNTQAQTANQNRQVVQGQFLAQLLGNKGVQGLGQQAYSGLKNLYNDWTPPSYQQESVPESSSYEWT